METEILNLCINPPLKIVYENGKYFLNTGGGPIEVYPELSPCSVQFKNNANFCTNTENYVVNIDCTDTGVRHCAYIGGKLYCSGFLDLVNTQYENKVFNAVQKFQFPVIDYEKINNRRRLCMDMDMDTTNNL